MHGKKIEGFRKKLEDAQQRTLKIINSIEERGLKESLQDSIQELSTYDNHPADVGSETFERSKDLALKDNEQIRLQKIEHALSRIKEGKYGHCEICGREIPLERLEALPETTMCAFCRAQWEREGRQTTRPIEEEVISPPFGGMPKEESSRVPAVQKDTSQYDGEDAWQDVASFGTSETPSDLPGSARCYPDVYWDADEDRGVVEEVEGIAYYKGADGVFYEEIHGKDAKKIHKRQGDTTIHKTSN